jgi:hypothetical protein
MPFNEKLRRLTRALSVDQPDWGLQVWQRYRVEQKTKTSFAKEVAFGSINRPVGNDNP